MRVVLDANIFVSALLTQRGNARQIIDLWQAGIFKLLVSNEILSEIDRVLRYPRLQKIHRKSQIEITQFVDSLRRQAVVIFPSEPIAMATDESDNRYLECAVAGGADYVVTGDKKHLLPLRAVNGIPIIPPATFLILVQAEE